MEITKAHLDSQMQELQRQKDYHAIQQAACDGAMQVTQTMLNKLAEPVPEPKPETPTT